MTYWICCIVFMACNNENSQKKDAAVTSEIEGFVLTGTLDSYLSDKVYLNRIMANQLFPIDSSLIENNQFTFKGLVPYPERFALTFENYSTRVLLIIENTEFQISLVSNQINEPVITGSELNSKLIEYEQASKNIFKKIDLLFPQIQKARLENDANKLMDINMEMNDIELEFIDYSFQFVKDNRNSYIAAMILNDQLKTPKADTIRIMSTYNMLSDKVKKSPDAQYIASTLNLD